MCLFHPSLFGASFIIIQFAHLEQFFLGLHQFLWINMFFCCWNIQSIRIVYYVGCMFIKCFFCVTIYQQGCQSSLKVLETFTLLSLKFFLHCLEPNLFSGCVPMYQHTGCMGNSPWWCFSEKMFIYDGIIMCFNCWPIPAWIIWIKNVFLSK